MHKPISHNDVVRLLALAANGDQRTVGDEDIALWLGVARMHRWTAAAAAAAIVEHYGAGADRPRITPAAITDRIREIRRAAAQTFELPRMPDDLPNADYPRWLRAQRDHHVAALVGRWATTGDAPPVEQRVAALVVRGPDQLADQAPHGVRREIASGVDAMLRRKP